LEKLKGLICTKLDVNIKEEDISTEVSLYEDGLGLDSIAIFDLIVLMENKFSFKFEDSELNADLFKNIDSLVQFIDTKLSN
jgi:acyl carrier protein